jgi:hypothetical protein
MKALDTFYTMTNIYTLVVNQVRLGNRGYHRTVRQFLLALSETVKVNRNAKYNYISPNGTRGTIQS